MSTTELHDPSRDAALAKVDLKLEIQIVPASDVDRSKQFYQRLGWRLNAARRPAGRPSHRSVHAPPAPRPRSRSAQDSRRPRPARPREG